MQKVYSPRMSLVSVDSVLDRFRRVGALLEGHFRLTSGLHSPGYLQCALVLQHPREAEACGAEIAALLAERGLYWRLYQLQYSDEKLHVSMDMPVTDRSLEPGVAH